MKLNDIYLGDCIKIMKDEIDSNCIDLVYADPPYNLSGKSLN
jgi:site-specific DNA-methyltransferase (adenine-specific)/modification methylase